MRTLIFALSLAACAGPSPPAGVVYWISVDVERPSTAVTIDGDMVDPGTGPRGHAVSLKTPFDDWKQAIAGAPFVVTAQDGDTIIGQETLTPGACGFLCANGGGCTLDDVKYEWQAAEVEASGAVVFGCTRCENDSGVAIAGDCAPAPPISPPTPP